MFLDNNVLAHEYGLQQIEELGREQIWVDFNQGLDARLITSEVARAAVRTALDALCPAVLRY